VNFVVEISGFSETFLAEFLINFFEAVDLLDVPDFESIFFALDSLFL
jgi:hypothetical protein